MNTAHFPPPCTVITALLTGGSLSVHAEAKTPGRREIDLQCNGLKLTRPDWEIVCATLLTARLALEVPPLPYSLNLTLSGPSQAAISDPEQLQAVVTAAILADCALQQHWDKGTILTLGRCHLDSGKIRIEALAEARQKRGLQILADMRTGGSIPWLVLPRPGNTDEEVLRRHIQDQHPGIRETSLEEILGSREAISADRWQRNISVFFPVVDLAAPNPATDCLLELKARVAAANDANESEICVQGGSAQQREHIRALVNAFRTRDNPTNRHWKTWITLPKQTFSGNSYELALLLADRIARGREFPMPHGKRLIATGCLSRDEPLPETMQGGTFGSIYLPTDTLARKCDLFRREARPGERILLPGNWQGDSDLNLCRNQLRALSVSMAPINTLLISPSRN